jgi:hypothetical protein
MRIPVAVSLESRDGTVSRDAKVVNGLVEAKGQPILRKRPGFADLGLIHAATAQMLYSWSGLNAILGDSLYRGTQATIVSGPTTTAISPTTASLRFDAQEVGSSAATQVLMVKNRTQAWTIDRVGTKTAISFASNMGSATYSVASLTRSSGTATATFLTDPGFNVGDTVTIAGAGQAAYNGAQTVTAVTAASSTPATTVSISSLTRSSTTATAVTATAHGLTNGNTYAISGANQSAYNGSYAVAVVNSTTFTYTVTVTPGTVTTWNASDKGADVTLTAGSLTASASGGASDEAVRASQGFASGKWYWEVSFSTNPAESVGVANSSATLNGNIGVDANGWGYLNLGSKFHSGSSAYGATYAVGDVIGVALDMDSGTLTFYKNGVSQGQAFTGITGTIYPAVSVSTSNGAHATANFGATAFAYSAPAGFNAPNADTPITPATGSPIVTIPGTTTNATMSYAVAGTPTTPATGTITAQTNGGMVPGIAYIDGYFVVMDLNGVMWHSDLDNPASWPALNFDTAQNENGRGMGIGKALNYLVAFKEWSTEFFYDAKNLTGFVFDPVDNGFTQVGCASGESVAKVDGALVWLSQVKERGRSVHVMSGIEQQKVSTPDVDRILNADDLSTVYAYGLKIDGHALYVLTLVHSNITLVYDMTAQAWYQWTSQTIGAGITSTITRSGSTATVTTNTAHGLSDGDPVNISGATQNEYNGIFQARVVSSTVFAITVSGSPLTPATGTISAKPYTSSYFKFTKYCDYQGLNLFLHETDGHLYQMLPTLYRDAGLPIDLMFRTSRLDGGSSDIKVMGRMTVVGDQVSDTMHLRWSDDDCSTFSAYREADLSLQRAALRRCGSFRRRTIEGRHVGNTSPRIEAIDLEV